MNIFPTKILLATDGSEDAQLAAGTAVDLSKKLGSELHVVYVEPMPERRSEHGRFRVDLPAEVVESVEKEAETKLEEQARGRPPSLRETTGTHATRAGAAPLGPLRHCLAALGDEGAPVEPPAAWCGAPGSTT
jgi:nucleotide-binding universal stress UspA family protein